MLAAVILVVVISMGMLLLRAVMGPSIFDKILAMNCLGNNVIVLIILLGSLAGTTNYVDIAIIYSLISFVTIIAFLMYFKYKSEE